MTESSYSLDPQSQQQMDENAEMPEPQSTDSAFDHDKFLMHQKRLAISEKYYVYDESGECVLFVHREAHHLRTILAAVAACSAFVIVGGMSFGVVYLITGSSNTFGILEGVLSAISVLLAVAALITVATVLYPKRHITFYSDDSCGTELLKVYQDKKWQIPIATYTIADAELNMLGVFRKNYLYDIFRKQWQVYDPDGKLICIAKEDSILKSALRRVLGPMYGLLRTNFVILGPDGTTELGRFNRKLTLFDKYVLDMTSDGARTLDRRIAVALGVLLDTGERR
ncbi:MAG: hypothetical protein IH984_17540 [Planctomycetes bacterium]|nr:hypothetical protein [Planctomycetota bacterium]